VWTACAEGLVAVTCASGLVPSCHSLLREELQCVHLVEAVMRLLSRSGRCRREDHLQQWRLHARTGITNTFSQRKNSKLQQLEY
jgi:ammonia channel protein AmtB